MAPRRTEVREKPVGFRGLCCNSEGVQRRILSYSLAPPPSGWLGAGEGRRGNRSNQGYHGHIQSTDDEGRNMGLEPHISRFQYGSTPMMVGKSSLSCGVLTWASQQVIEMIFRSSVQHEGDVPEAGIWAWTGSQRLTVGIFMLPPSSSCSPGLQGRGNWEWGVGWAGLAGGSVYPRPCTWKRGKSGEAVHASLGGTQVASGVALPPVMGDYRCPNHHCHVACTPSSVDSHVPRGVRILTLYDAIKPYYIICFFFSVLLTFNT